MISDERLTVYLHSLDAGNGAFCDAMEREARASGIPIIRKETADLL